MGEGAGRSDVAIDVLESWVGDVDCDKITISSCEVPVEGCPI